MKFLLWLAIGFAVIWLLRSKKPHAKADAARHDKGVNDKDAATEPMVRCMQCGVYLPASEALLNSSGDVFCCEEHRSRQSPA